MSPEEALEVALLGRLYTEGRCIEAKRTAALIERYELARWVRRGTRRREWVVREKSRTELGARLAALLPGFEAEFSFLRERDHDPFDPASLLMLATLHAAASPQGRAFLNRRNWNAAAGSGPKLQARRSADGTRITQDWVVRMRTYDGLIIGGTDGERPAAAWSLDGHEVVIPERAFLAGLQFGGEPPTTLITVENLGSYVDLPLPVQAMAVYSPGKDWRGAIALLERFPSARWTHFGDLDPEGVDIAMDLAAKSGRPLRLFVPSFAGEYLDRVQKHGVEWPPKALRNGRFPVLEELRTLRAGILQEVFILDHRLGEELEREVQQS
jgi:hypothetical protein